MDAKITRYRAAGDNEIVQQLHKEKKLTIARLKKLKAVLQVQGIEEVTTPPPPAPPVPPPPPPPKVTSAGMFGMGVTTDWTVGYVMGNSIIVARADILMGDGLGIGPMLGMASDAVNWRIGLGGAMGKDINDNEKKAIPLFVDGLINIPADVMGGIESYVGGGVNYVLYGSGQEMGSYGGQVYYGIQGDIGLGGNSYAELGYSVIRSGASVKNTVQYSMKGFAINLGTRVEL
ncbi:MAG: hypothetical protein HQ596_06060 [Candidatus Saganbacteria bacterium]|nr:hypothetical protein [Candidatus Saganbacteria bacterium]